MVVSLDGRDSNTFTFHQLTWEILYNARVFFALTFYLVLAGIIALIAKRTVFKSVTGKWSLSKLQMGIWTFVFGLFYVIISAANMEFIDITEGMFWLMGISSATAAGAKAIVLKNDIGIPKNPSGLLHDWDGKKYALSLHRVQIAVWTLIVLTIFVIGVIETMRLQEIPNNLLVLMGISGGTYLGFNYPKSKKV